MNYRLYIHDNWKRILGYLLTFVVLFILSAFASFSLLVGKFTLEMPELVGRELSEVNDMLEELALTVTVTGEEFHREIDKGNVLSQSIEPGRIVRGQSIVEITLSKGPEVRLIPSVIAMKLQEARDMLSEQEMAIDGIIRVHANRGSGTVLAQHPEPDEWTGQAMTLLVSAGPRDVIYYNPYFQGMAKMDALILARDLGLSVRISELDNTNVISYQSPAPGAEIRRGEVLKLRVGG